MNKTKIVTRFAPSPTGFLHVGGVRTALFAWLFARQNDGTFILRIEDTDREREVPGSVEHIMASLTWLGLHWDPVGDEPQGIYVQSKRLDLYRAYAQKLVEKGCAYSDPYTPEQIEQFRAQAIEEKRPFLFRDHRPKTLEPWDGKKPLRFRVPLIKRYEWSDLVRGALSAGEEALDDFILIKGDGYPTYNFSHIVDDIEMGITHVIRGEEFISSTPKFLSLYEALGVEPPLFVTMPAILGADGNKKLSKRDGAKDLLLYRDEGFIPEAMVNFLALLGWHPEGEQEIFTPEELIQAFELERVQKSGARFDEIKLRWINREHLRRQSGAEYVQLLRDYVGSHGEVVPEYLESIAGLLQERAETLGEAKELLVSGEFLFMEDSISIGSELLMKGAKAEAGEVCQNLKGLKEIVSEIPDTEWSAERVKREVMGLAEEKGKAAVLWPLRAALSGREKSPDPFTIAELVGKNKALERIKQGIQALS